jgi:hypothetical protein
MLSFNDARYELFAAVKTEFAVFWVVALCSVAVEYRRFGGTCCLQLQRQYGPPKRCYPTITLHGATTQKTRKSNFHLRLYYYYYYYIIIIIVVIIIRVTK